jgi:hypothetical protein
VHAFTPEDWNRLLLLLTKAIGPAANAFSTSPAARLMAAIPYLSGSEDADRFAVSNLMTLHAARQLPELFGPRAGDETDLFRPLATFHVGNHADPRVVDYGLTLLAWLALGAEATPSQRDELRANLDRSPWMKERFLEAVGSDVAAGLGAT